MRSAIVLAGGGSTRMRSDKGLKTLAGVPLVVHTLGRLQDTVDEIVIVLGSEEQREAYAEVIEDADMVVDLYDIGTPLVGAITGFEAVKGDYALVAACDMPFISPEAVDLLFREAEGHDGAVFQWPNGWIEPFLAVYKVGSALPVAQELIGEGNLRVRMILRRLGDVVMIPMDSLRVLDPDLLSLHDADTEESLLEAEKILKKEKK